MQGKWGVGRSAVVVYMSGEWVLGVLANNIWSYSGQKNRTQVNQFLLQYFINYNLPHGWFIVSAPIITANWKAPKNEKWVVPFGLGIGRTLFIDKQALSISLQGFYNAKRPKLLGPEWTLRLALTQGCPAIS